MVSSGFKKYSLQCSAFQNQAINIITLVLKSKAAVKMEDIIFVLKISSMDTAKTVQA